VLFLIEYDRVSGRLVGLQSYSDADRQRASNDRIDLELRLNREQVEREVVLLEAASEEDLRKTHRRYFEGLTELAGRSASASRTSATMSEDSRD
jgi:hypothetical protein